MKIRNILKTFGILCMLLVFAAMPVITVHAAQANTPTAQEPVPPGFTPEQTFLLGLVATVLVWGVNFFYRNRGLKISRKKLTVVLFVVGLVMAGLFQAFTLPTFSGWPEFQAGEDFAESVGLFLIFIGQVIGVVYNYLMSLVVSATALTGSGTIIYNLLKEKIFPQLPDVIEDSVLDAGGNVAKGPSIDMTDFRG